MEVGTIVRVPLHGRRVRGWVVDDPVEPPPGVARLLPLAGVVSAGPPPEVVALCRWIAWRWCGPVTGPLRAASPRNVVPPAVGERGGDRPEAGRDAGSGPPVRTLVVWPPAADRRELVRGLVVGGGSTIVVVPDAARLGSLTASLEQSGHRVVVLSGTHPAAQRTRMWRAARAGRCVVVGGRVAALAPVPDLAAVVVLDEADEALKEERAPAWHGREVGLERARRRGVPATLVSPVPTPEAAAACGAPQRPDRMVERAGWPPLEIVDRRDQPPGTGLLSEPLARAVRGVIEAGGRAVCVVNRRGRARLAACATCGELARCEHCGAAVGEGAGEGEHGLACARCGTARPRVCLGCQGTRLRVLRPGVRRLREELAALFGRAEVAEVDAATTGEVPAADVLVGTEAVLHRAPRLPARPIRLVAFLDFDQELCAPRSRAALESLWLLVRGARLVGGRRGGGRLLVQTRVPDHEVLTAAREADPQPVLVLETERRRDLGYPPFGGLAELRGDLDALEHAAAGLTRAGLVVLGPTGTGTGAAARALVQAPDPSRLADALADALAAARSRGRLRVEVDPLRV